MYYVVGIPTQTISNSSVESIYTRSSIVEHVKSIICCCTLWDMVTICATFYQQKKNKRENSQFKI